MYVNFDFGASISDAWRKLMNNVGYILLMLVPLFLTLFLYGGFVFILLFLVLNSNSSASLIVLLGLGLLGIVVCTVNLFVVMIGYKVALHLARGKSFVFSQWRDFVPSFSEIMGFIFLSIILSLIVYVGLILLIIPGVYLAIKLNLVFFAYLDQPDKGIFNAIKRAWMIGEDNFVGLLIVSVLAILAYMLGSMVAVIGLAITMPLYNILASKYYFALSGMGDDSENQQLYDMHLV